jgi:hypothetical protein
MMLAILRVLGIFACDLLKLRRWLNGENLCLRHRLNIALRRASLRPRLRGCPFRKFHPMSSFNLGIRCGAAVMKSNAVRRKWIQSLSMRKVLLILLAWPRKRKKPRICFAPEACSNPANTSMSD